MALPAVAPLVCGEPIEHGAVRRALQVHVERCIDPQSALVHLTGAVFRLKVAADFLDEVRRQ